MRSGRQRHWRGRRRFRIQIGEDQRRRPSRWLSLRTKSNTPAGGGLRHFRFTMGERQSTSRGAFAVTESDCKHAPCRLRINAVADDRGFVALEASGSDDEEG